MKKRISRIPTFFICFLVIFTSGVAYATSDSKYVDGEYLIDRHIFYSDGDGSNYPVKKEITYKGKTYEFIDFKNDKIGEAKKIVKKVKIKDKSKVKTVIYGKDDEGNKIKLRVDKNKIKWKKVLASPKVVRATYKNNENVPAVIKIDKDGKKVNAKRTSLRKRDINTRISAPAIFYGYGNSYMFNKKLITVGSNPIWSGYEKEVMSYLNRNDITKVLGGRWTSGYRNVNGKWIRYASYDVLRRDSISEATFTEDEESRIYYAANVEYVDPNADGKNLIKWEGRYKEKENKIMKILVIGAGILIFALTCAIILRFVSKKRKKEEDINN